MSTPYAIGVDLSYTATGIAWPDPNDELAQTTVVDTFSTAPDDGDDIVRACLIRNHVVAHARSATMVVLEDGVNRSHAAFRSGVMHGIVRQGLADVAHKTTLVLVPPAVVKKYATGRGNTDKTAMVIAARERLGYAGTDHNEADAMWLRAIGHELLDAPLCRMPVAQRDVLAKLGVFA